MDIIIILAHQLINLQIKMQILKSEIEAFQLTWAERMISMSEAYFEGEDYRSLAMDFVEDIYAFDTEQVLFKPLFTKNNPFRNDKLSALSYLIGGNPNFKEDTGFAMREWKTIKFKIEDAIYKNDITIAMGTCYYVDMEGNEYISEETMGFILDKNEVIKINLHHSSLQQF